MTSVLRRTCRVRMSLEQCPLFSPQADGRLTANIGRLRRVPTAFALSEYRQMPVAEGARILRGDRDLALDRIEYRHREIHARQPRAAFQIARREDVHLQDLVADDVDANQEHAVAE